MQTHAAMTVLTQEDHEHFIEHGFLVLRDVVPPEVVDEALRTLDAGSADYQSIGAAAVKACVTDRLHQAIAELFGPEYEFQRHRNVRSMPRPYTPDAAEEAAGPEEPAIQGGAHLDEDKPTAMPHTWAVEAWVFLTPVRHRGGAFMFSPGSPTLLKSILLRGHRVPIGGWFTEPLLAASAGPLPLELPVPLREFLAEPGDVLLYPHLMAHCGSTNVADPTTRQAVLARFVPNRRVVPGTKPFERMSTLEKVNSARYLRQRFGARRFPLTDCDAPGLEARLRGGVAPATTLVSHASLRFGGRTHLFLVERGRPDRVSRVSTTDWSTWRSEAAINVGTPVARVTVMHHYPGIVLCLTPEDPAAAQVLLLRSPDLGDWEELARLHLDAAEAQPGYLTLAESRAAQGNVVFFVERSQPRSVRWLVGEDTYGQDWDEAPTWSWQGVAVRYDGPGRITGLASEPVAGEARHGLVLTVAGDPGGSLLATVSGDAAQFAEPLQPLEHGLDTDPLGLRVYDRAHEYWMVSYERALPEGPGVSVRWGWIDWASRPLRLHEIATTSDLERALCTIGLL